MFAGHDLSCPYEKRTWPRSFVTGMNPRASIGMRCLAAAALAGRMDLNEEGMELTR